MTPKIGARQKPTMPYDYDSALNMHMLGPGEPALLEWRAAGLETPNMDAVRAWRLERTRRELRKRDIGAIVLFDPLNIRHASDSTNMQLWTAHNAARYCYVAADGPMIVFDYHDCEHLSAHNPLIDEVRPAQSWFYFLSGDRLRTHAKRWAAEIADLLKQHGGGNNRLAVDKLNPEGAAALADLGAEVVCGESVMEHARLIKCADEVKAMRCAIAACEKALAVVRENARPGVSENRLWAHLHAENIARGGEWIETRIVCAGPRTNPWFQECSSRPTQSGEILALDTDLIGAYGMCVDISRSWVIGDDPPSPARRQLYDMAYAQIRHNRDIIRPGMSWRELSEKAKIYPVETYRHYSQLFHGVGLCDEYPAVPMLYQFEDGDDNVAQPGMMLCVESYVARRDGGEGVKLEEKILLGDNGIEVLSECPAELSPA